MGVFFSETPSPYWMAVGSRKELTRPLAGVVFRPGRVSQSPSPLAKPVRGVSFVMDNPAMRQVRAQGFARYKLMCYVVLGQKAGQSMMVSSRGLWDTSTDSFACETFSNASIYAIATVYGVYFE
uniref:Uncharacterized protein n=1 Tax=Eptatretus burgeri TaxID=7764 RepID=A0A8C4NCH3_EPTBU